MKVKQKAVRTPQFSPVAIRKLDALKRWLKNSRRNNTLLRVPLRSKMLMKMLLSQKFPDQYMIRYPAKKAKAVQERA